jgi:GT2 family glycosyltransferase
MVSVVVPAWNAAPTIAETLESAMRQTYRQLDIIVVDDGSHDETAEIVSIAMQRDPRIRLIKQRNAGVASARNTGIAAAKGDFIAPLDADDLWHPTKIEKQLAAMLAGGPETGLVYSPYRFIDSRGLVIRSSPLWNADGWILCQHIYVNVVGNGSGALMRKSAILQAGGYDSTLRDAGFEGCEDLLLQLRIASRCRFALVPEALVGYRVTSQSMSARWEQMLQSEHLALALVRDEVARVPSRVFRVKRAENFLFWSKRKAQQGLWPQAIVLAAKAVSSDARWTVMSTVRLLRKMAALATRPSPALERHSRHFYDFDPNEGLHPVDDTLRRLWIRKLSQIDRRMAAVWKTLSGDSGPQSAT